MDSGDEGVTIAPRSTNGIVAAALPKR